MQRIRTFKQIICLFLLGLLICFISILLYIIPNIDNVQLEYHEENIDDQTIIGKYTNKKGELVLSEANRYAVVMKNTDSSGRVIEECYYDTQNKLTERFSGGYYCIKFRYNRLDQVIEEEYLDKHGVKTENSAGYASICTAYNEFGKVFEEFYFNKDETPAVLNYGQSGTRYVYDENGQIVQRIFLDHNHDVLSGKNGISSIRYTYNEDVLCTEMYYDIDGNQVCLQDGQYGIKHIGDNIISLDKNGTVKLTVGNILNLFPWVVVVIGFILAAVAVVIPNRFRLLYLLLYIAFILYETVAFRETGGINLTPLWSYKQFFSNYNLRLEILNNIWLFVPFGAGMYSLIRKKWIVIIPLVFSILIEVSQYIFGLGLCEIDDVISNTLGGAIGMMMAASLLDIKVWWKNRKTVVNV